MFPIHYTRYIFWNFADVNDLWRFPYHVIKKGDDAFRFEVSPGWPLSEFRQVLAIRRGIP